MNFAVDLAERLIRSGICLPEQIAGCSESEIGRLEIHAGGRFPLLYRSFLLQIGHGAGRFLAGTDIFYDKLFYLRNWAECLLEEEQAEFRLADPDFVFAMHQDYQFMYFNLSELDVDPGIYRYLEGELAPSQVGRFSDVLLDFVREEEQSVDS